MGKKISVVVDNDKKKFPPEVAEIRGAEPDEAEREDILKSVAFLASQVLKGEVTGYALVTINAEGNSTASFFTSSCMDDIHLTLAGIEILRDRFKDECIDLWEDE